MSQVLSEHVPVPPSIEIITEERIDDVGRKVITKRKIQKKVVISQVSEAIAVRRNWKKFGEASSHPPGPNTKTTLLGEPVFLTLATGKDFDLEEPGESIMLKNEKSKTITCRYCEGPHWSIKCPHKDVFLRSSREKSSSDNNVTLPSPSKYVPPSLRKDSSTTGLSSPSSTFDGYTVRVTNLSENTTEHDLRELFKHAGAISRVYLSKDRSTNLCKGYAFVSFHKQTDAERAIAMVNNHGYGNLILKVEFAKYN